MDLLELGKNPISGDAPAGIDARFEPEYEEMQAEVGKLSSPSSSGPLNWTTVRTLCEKILAEKSKDMLVGSYLVVALLHTEQIPGLAKGFAFYKEMITNFWEGLSPPLKRMRGRKNAMEWMYAQAEEYLKEYKGAPVPEELMNAMNADLEAIAEFVGEKMADDPPYSRSFDEVLRMVPVQVKEAPKPAAPPPPAPGAAPAASAAPAAASALDVPGEITSDQDVTKLLNAAFKVLKQVSNHQFEKDPASPVPYAFNRLIAWSQIAALPPNENKVTKIPPPPEQVRTILQNLAQNGDWDNLLKASETKINQFLFWLDLSRMSYDALGHLGPKALAAQQAVARETLAFVKRLKGIDTFTFADETPFADPETRQWLEELANASQGGGGGGGGGGESEDALVEQQFDAARQLAKDKDLAGAADLLQQHLQSSPNGKLRLKWRMALARFLILSKKPQPAQPHLTQIMADIERFQLEEWEPELALEGLKVVLSAVRFLKDEASAALTRDVLERISRLNPGEALRLE